MSRKIRYSGYSFASCPIEAQTFLTATGITDATITSAICTLVKDLKENGLWVKMKAVYPMVGGVATTHKFNLKDPQDLDSAFRLDFSGGWIHSSNGALPNGTNATANTFLIPSIDLTDFDTHLSYYSRTDTAGKEAGEIGCSNTGGGAPNKPFFNISVKFNNNNGNYDMNSFGTGRVQFNMVGRSTQGFFLQSRVSNNLQFAYKNGLQLGADNTTTEPVTLPNQVVRIGATELFGIYRYSDRECAFASIGSGLSKAETVILNTIINNFQTTLGRNV